MFSESRNIDVILFSRELIAANVCYMSTYFNHYDYVRVFVSIYIMYQRHSFIHMRFEWLNESTWFIKVQ